MKIPVVRKDFGNGINALHWISAHGCGEYAPVQHEEFFGSPDVKILPHYAVHRAGTHLVRCLHMSGCDHRFVCNELQIFRIRQSNALCCWAAFSVALEL